MKTKERMKGFVVGFALATILSATAVFAVNTTTLEVIHGVNVVINGDTITFDSGNSPFIAAGHTFLPLRAIADALNIPVYWDAATATAYLGTRPATAEMIHGTWRVVSVESIAQGQSYPLHVYEQTMTFNPDGTVIYTLLDDIDMFRWTLTAPAALILSHPDYPDDDLHTTANILDSRLVLRAYEEYYDVVFLTFVMTMEREE